MSTMQGMNGMTGASYWNDVGGAPFANNGVTRPYYIAADPVDWDYAPLGHNAITGEPFDDAANVFVKSGPGRIGSKYEMCLYRAYSDASFQHLLPRPELFLDTLAVRDFPHGPDKADGPPVLERGSTAR